MESAFEGDKTETKTMLPVIEVFMAAHGLPGRHGAAAASTRQFKITEHRG
jgi:hypothetical protein